MAIVRPEPYTEDLKAYLTYPPTIDVTPLLLQEKMDIIYQIEINGVIAIGDRLPSPLAKELMAMGIKVKKTTRTVLKGREAVFGIPVQVRKIIHRKKDGKHELEAIRVRVTGKNIDELNKNKNQIISGFARYNVLYTECIWVSTARKAPKKEKTPKNKPIHEEKIQKLTNVVEDLRDEVESLKRPAIEKRKHEDATVKAGVLH